MASDRLIVLLAGTAGIALVLWYFLLGARRAVVARAAPGGIQEAEIIVQGGYNPSEIRVDAGLPVRLVFDRREDNPCSDEVIIADLGLRRVLPAHRKTTLDLPAMEPGVHDFHCGMGMLHGRVIVT